MIVANIAAIHAAALAYFGPIAKESEGRAYCAIEQGYLGRKVQVGLTFNSSRTVRVVLDDLYGVAYSLYEDDIRHEGPRDEAIEHMPAFLAWLCDYTGAPAPDWQKSWHEIEIARVAALSADEVTAELIPFLNGRAADRWKRCGDFRNIVLRSDGTVTADAAPDADTLRRALLRAYRSNAHRRSLSARGAAKTKANQRSPSDDAITPDVHVQAAPRGDAAVNIVDLLDPIDAETTDWEHPQTLEELIFKFYPEFSGVHPLADLLPVYSREDYVALRDDIKNTGLKYAIDVTPDGLLLDGRHRLLACYEARQDIRIQVVRGDPAAAWVSANLKRAHLGAHELADIEQACARQRAEGQL